MNKLHDDVRVYPSNINLTKNAVDFLCKIVSDKFFNIGKLTALTTRIGEEYTPLLKTMIGSKRHKKILTWCFFRKEATPNSLTISYIDAKSISALVNVLSILVALEPEGTVWENQLSGLLSAPGKIIDISVSADEAIVTYRWDKNV